MKQRRLDQISSRLMALSLAWLCLIQPVTGDEPGSTESDRPSPASTLRNFADKVKLIVRTERNVVFSEPEGVPIKADLYRPDSTDLLPLVIMIHGGGWISGDKWNVTNHAYEMAEAGYVVMAINYRLSPKYKWPAHLEDCRAALHWMSDNADNWKADMNRVAAWGYSAGGHLSLMLALDPGPKQPKVKAVVAGGAPCDLSFVPENSDVLTPFIGGSPREYPSQYRLASPIAHLNRSSPPVFMFHGTEDLLVPLDNSYKFFESAAKLGVPCEYHKVDKIGHLLAFVDAESRSRAIAFFDKHLKPRLDHDGSSSVK